MLQTSSTENEFEKWAAMLDDSRDAAFFAAVGRLVWAMARGVEVEVPPSEDPRRLVVRGHEQRTLRALRDGRPPAPLVFPQADDFVEAVEGVRFGVQRALLVRCSAEMERRFVVRADPQQPAVVNAGGHPLALLLALLHAADCAAVELAARFCTAWPLHVLLDVHDAATELDAAGPQLLLAAAAAHRACAESAVFVWHRIQHSWPAVAQRVWRLLIAEFHAVAKMGALRFLRAAELRRLLDARVNSSAEIDRRMVAEWLQMNAAKYEAAGRANPRRRAALRAEVEALEAWEPPPDRLPFSAVLLLGGWGANAPIRQTALLDTYADQWRSLPPSDELDVPAVAFHAAARLGDRVFAAGGTFGSHTEFSRRVFCVDLRKLSWTEMPEMELSSPRCYASLTAVGADRLLLAGGHTGERRVGTTEMFVLGDEAGRWERLPSLNFCRSDAASVWMDGRVLLVGGFDGDTAFDSAEVFEPQRGHWTPLAARMRSRRTAPAAIETRGVVLVAGGHDGSRRSGSVEFFDPREGRWNEVAPMGHVRSNFGFTLVRDDPLAIAGCDPKGVIQHCELFEWRANRWRPTTPVPVGRSGMTTVRLDEWDPALLARFR